MPNKPHNPLDGPAPELVINTHQQWADDNVSVIVVHKDQADYLNLCLQSVAVCSKNNNYEIIVVDNGSTDKDAVDFLDELQEQNEVKVIRNKENFWWAKAANQGVRAADSGSKYFIFLHHDVVVTNQAWIDLMINAVEAQHAGLVGVSKHTYEMDGQRLDFVEEWCMMVSRECWQDCGPFAEELAQIGAPFVFTLAAQFADHKPQIMRTPLAIHYNIDSITPSDKEQQSEKSCLLIPKLLKLVQDKYKR